MKFRKASLVIGLSLALGAALPAAAHHSAAMYDSAHPVTIEATVKSFEWINPHSVLEVSTEPTAALPTTRMPTATAICLEGAVALPPPPSPVVVVVVVAVLPGGAAGTPPPPPPPPVAALPLSALAKAALQTAAISG